MKPKARYDWKAKRWDVPIEMIEAELGLKGMAGYRATIREAIPPEEPLPTPTPVHVTPPVMANPSAVNMEDLLRAQPGGVIRVESVYGLAAMANQKSALVSQAWRQADGQRDIGLMQAAQNAAQQGAYQQQSGQAFAIGDSLAAMFGFRG